MFDQDVSDMEQLEGPVNFAHQFVDMPNYAVEIQDTDGPKTVRFLDNHEYEQDQRPYETLLLLKFL